MEDSGKTCDLGSRRVSLIEENPDSEIRREVGREEDRLTINFSGLQIRENVKETGTGLKKKTKSSLILKVTRGGN